MKSDRRAYMKRYAKEHKAERAAAVSRHQKRMRVMKAVGKALRDRFPDLAQGAPAPHQADNASVSEVRTQKHAGVPEHSALPSGAGASSHETKED